ncbi:restriction endonuclease [Maribacter thermophilus]|uniref:restriction endonuclease n=1 Tax=Maribacter thermophilus TaxID=1197874 RepID=UPI000641565C|nr:restriction endonuclease [Maribacter thermophilus]
MSFLKTRSKKDIDQYCSYLRAIGAFSNLYSSSDKPFIQYRVAENAFCKAFDAKNLARADVAYDAVISGFGIGIKTFILSGNSKIEKVAEFNSLSIELRNLKGLELANRLSDYRNERISFADRAYGIDKRIYHIVGRDKGVIKIFEVGYDLIDKASIEIISENKSSLKFKDLNNEYNFNFSKSVLMKRFVVPEDCIEIDVEIIDEPIEALLDLTSKKVELLTDNLRVSNLTLLEDEELIPGKDYVILPLYSPNAKNKNKEPIVPLKSQLNQWNAGGRDRDPGEVYIAIPKIIHELAPGFLPKSNVVFTLKVPSGEALNAKVCQAGDKALMTNPNNAMADWMLRKVLNLQPRELLTYSKLKNVGYDSVKITKITNAEFLIDFAQLDEYENFLDKAINHV